MRVLITGTAGFIGFHLARRLLKNGDQVVGVDGFTHYYDVELKRRRHSILLQNDAFREERLMLDDVAGLDRIWSETAFDVVIHLAAQAGVRHSVQYPRAFIDANLVGTFNVMELVRRRPVAHFLVASTSAIYGGNSKIPFVESDKADEPLSLYAATKKSTELMAHSYSHLWNIPTTAIRFFSVYGPWGRPDMAPHKFTRGIIEGAPIDIYNFGNMQRDFTYIDDLVEAIDRLVQRPPERKSPDSSPSTPAPFRAVNVGCGQPVDLLAFLAEFEKNLGKQSVRNFLPMQPGDAPTTFANVDLLEQLTEFRPSTTIAVGVNAFVEWYRGYYAV